MKIEFSLHPGLGDFKLNFKHRGDAGADLPVLAIREVNGIIIPETSEFPLPAGDTAFIRTGVRLCMPIGISGIIKERSSVARAFGLYVIGGVIDSPYRGEIYITIRNGGQRFFNIRKGDRIAQIVFTRMPGIELIAGNPDEWSETTRSDNGFGSTGA